MTVFPNAKINIGLNVTAKRPDGFHDIETVFYPVDFCDVLEFVPNTKGLFDLQNFGIQLDAGRQDNLVFKAYELIRKEYNLPGSDVALYKNIPTGAGLGGGSSDAAFMLKMLNDAFSLNLSEDDLLNYAARLGSDCAFFIKNRPIFASGRGDVFSKINLKLENYYLLLTIPKFSISTPQAYSEITPTAPEVPLRQALRQHPEDWRHIVKNDFETVVFRHFPQSRQIKKAMYRQAAVYASLSGSGSAFYGLFREKPDPSCFESYGMSKVFRLR